MSLRDFDKIKHKGKIYYSIISICDYIGWYNRIYNIILETCYTNEILKIFEFDEQIVEYIEINKLKRILEDLSKKEELSEEQGNNCDKLLATFELQEIVG